MFRRKRCSTVKFADPKIAVIGWYPAGLIPSSAAISGTRCFLVDNTPYVKGLGDALAGDALAGDALAGDAKACLLFPCRIRKDGGSGGSLSRGASEAQSIAGRSGEPWRRGERGSRRRGGARGERRPGIGPIYCGL
jgi:hypothetical protein